MYTRRELAAELVAFLTQRGGGTTVRRFHSRNPRTGANRPHVHRTHRS